MDVPNHFELLTTDGQARLGRLTDEGIAKELRRLAADGSIVVLATHDIALMDLYDAPRLVLHEGRLQVYT